MHFHVVSTFHIFCRHSASQGTKTQLADARRHHSSVRGRGSGCDLRGQLAGSAFICCFYMNMKVAEELEHGVFWGEMLTKWTIGSHFDILALDIKHYCEKYYNVKEVTAYY